MWYIEAEDTRTETRRGTESRQLQHETHKRRAVINPAQFSRKKGSRATTNRRNKLVASGLITNIGDNKAQPPGLD